MESALSIGFLTTTTTTTSISLGYRPWLSYDDFNSHRKITKTISMSLKKRIRVAAALSNSSSASEDSDPPSYHPFEEIGDSTSTSQQIGEPTPAETTRTLIEVNSKATLMFTGLVDDQFHDNIFWPDLPYLTDEHGNIYFEVKDDEDILQTLTTENNYVQVIIGLDTVEMLNEMGLGPSDIDFGFEEISEEASDDDDDGEEDKVDDDDGNDGYEDWVGILDGEEDDLDSDGTLGDWAKLETMRSSHPMYFAKKLTEVAADDPMMDCMDQPSAGLAIQGLLQPAFLEERSVIRKHMPDRQSTNDDTNPVEKSLENLDDPGINGHDHKSDLTSSSKDGSIWAAGEEKDESPKTGSSFYKIEMVKIQLISPHGNQIHVEINDFRKARPDAIAHSAPKIISRLNAGGEKTIQALKSLCWRVKGIQVEEAILIGIDSLGFDLRICSGTQVQNLRFAFTSKANSEYSAERQLHDLIFPRIQQKPQKRQEARSKDS